MPTRTERERALPREREDQGHNDAETEDEGVPSDGGLVRLDVPGSESVEE
jgi:hypothetical protein